MYTYIIEHFVHGVEAREETLLVVPSHFVRDTGKSIFCADDAVVGGIEAELDGLL
jgi:hypothetical protein